MGKINKSDYAQKTLKDYHNGYLLLIVFIFEYGRLEKLLFIVHSGSKVEKVECVMNRNHDDKQKP